MNVFMVTVKSRAARVSAVLVVATALLLGASVEQQVSGATGSERQSQAVAPHDCCSPGHPQGPTG